MLNSGTELLSLIAGINYEPTFISTDKRVSSPTTLNYWQIGELQQYGFARGPIFKIELVDLSSVTATHIKIWGIENKDNDAPLYPLQYFLSLSSQPIIDVYLKKFEFCDINGDPVNETTYTIVGYKKKVMPLSW